MEAQNELAYELPLPDIIAALLDFARIAQSVGSKVTDGTGPIAVSLLERLLTLCAAQKGAILLTTQYLSGLQQSSSPSFSSHETFRPFALSAMNVEDAFTLALHFSSGGAAVQLSPGKCGWLMYGLPVTVPLTSDEDVEAVHYITGHSGQTILPLYALVLLGWTGKDEDVYIKGAEHGKMILPRVAHAFGSAVLNILQAERIHELEAANDRKALSEMELLKAELLATVSHELRSPLSSIKGYAATLLRHERRISREERHEFLLAINDASDRLEVIINRLLEVSQLETGTIVINHAAVNLVHLAHEAIIAIEERLAQKEQLAHSMNGELKRFTFSIHLEDTQGMQIHTEPIIQADRMRLRDVLDNLLENAVNYSPEGGMITMVIRFSPRQKGGGSEQGRNDRSASTHIGTRLPMVEISIHDSGMGIPAEQLKAIFDRFHRVDTRLTREVNGLGLGLAICKHIIELHHGMIWAESEFGKGSTFHIWLPIDQSA